MTYHGLVIATAKAKPSVSFVVAVNKCYFKSVRMTLNASKLQ